MSDDATEALHTPGHTSAHASAQSSAQTPATPKVDISDLTMYYGDKLVLNQVDLAVAPGEAVVLIGASGSGKSTLVRCVDRLVPFDHGTISIDGMSINDDAMTERMIRSKVGIVFQSYNLFPTMNVLNNITLAPRRVHGVQREEAEERAHSLLEQFEMSEFAQSYPEQLSGGQQQRVAVVRAMATQPDILLLDEITAALDPELIGGVLQVIAGLKDQGITMIVVTHEMGFARDVADRVCFLDQGQIIESGPPDALLGSPQHARTQQFLQRITDAGRL